MMMKLLAIARNAFTETIRQPVYGVLLWVSIGWLLLNPTLAAFSLESGSDTKVLQDIGLATLLLYGLLASVFAATSVITRELESQTVLTVVSKPVSRTAFLLGKYLGVSGAVLLGYYLLMLVFFMTARHGVMEAVSDTYDLPILIFGGAALLISLTASVFGNYVYGWHFSATLTYWIVPAATLALLLTLPFDREFKPQAFGGEFGNLQLIYAALLVFCGVLILTAFAVTLATRFSQALTLLLCAGVYLLGLLSDHYFGLAQDRGLIFQLLYAITPNFQFFWAGDPLTQGLTIPASQVGLVLAYAMLYSLGVLCVGVALFQTREVS
jgi:ABC-2 type transport system permease protein